MLNKRQQLQQQQLIYGGSNSIHLIRGIRSELLKQPESPPKRQSKPDTSLPQATQKNTGTTQSPQRGSATSPQRNADARSVSQKNLDSKQKPPDSKGDGLKASIIKDVKGRPRRQRPPAYIPPIHYGDKHVPRNVVTIDTTKARGNTDVVRLVARDLGWREVSDLRDHVFFVSLSVCLL